jgi:PAS domain S-box-containing protein
MSSVLTTSTTAEGTSQGSDTRARSPPAAGKAPNYTQLVRSCTDAIIGLTLDGQITSWNAAAQTAFGPAAEQVIGASIFNVLPHLSPDHLAYLIDETIHNRRVAPIESTGPSASNRHRTTMSIMASPILDEDDQTIGVSLVAHDITASAEALADQALRLQDANHRIKNTLTLVQAIAGGMLRADSDPETFGVQFLRRLAALSRNHDLLADTGGSSLSLHDVLDAQMAPHCGDAFDRYSISGPFIRLKANLAVVVGMTFHELATNAAKYGALSARDGRVEIAWKIAEVDEARQLQLSWREIGGPPVSPPQRQGIGAGMIMRGLPSALGGSAQIDFDQSGVRYCLDAPLASIEMAE